MVKDHSDCEKGNLIGYSFRLTAKVLLYAPSHRQDNTYHGFCYTSRGALAGTRQVKESMLCILTETSGLDYLGFYFGVNVIEFQCGQTGKVFRGHLLFHQLLTYTQTEGRKCFI